MSNLDPKDTVCIQTVFDVNNMSIDIKSIVWSRQKKWRKALGKLDHAQDDETGVSITLPTFTYLHKHRYYYPPWRTREGLSNSKHPNKYTPHNIEVGCEGKHLH